MSPYLRRRLLTVIALVVVTPVAWTLGRAWEQRAQKRAEDKQAAERLFSCRGNVVGVELGSPNDAIHSIVVAKRLSAEHPYDANAAWKVEAPLRAAADETTMDALVEAACTLNRLSRIEAKEGEPPVALAAFGLEPARKFLRLMFDDGSEQRVDVGDASAFNQSMYVRQVKSSSDDAPSVDVVDAGFSFQMERDVLSLRDKRLIHVKNADVKRIEVRARGKQSFDVLQGEHGDYLIAQQGDATHPLQGDAQAVGTLLDGLVNLRAKQFMDEAPAPDRLSHFALDPPSIEVALGLSDTNERIMLRLGSLALDKERHLFAQVQGSTAAVAEVENQSVIDKLQDGGLSLRDMRLLHCNAADVARIEVAEKDSTLTLVRQGDASASAWALDGNDARALDASRISSMLYRLTHMRADTLGVDSATSEEMRASHLDAPELTISLVDHKGDRLGQLRLGPVSAERRAAVGDGERIGQVFASATEGISTRVDDYVSTP